MEMLGIDEVEKIGPCVDFRNSENESQNVVDKAKNILANALVQSYKTHLIEKIKTVFNLTLELITNINGIWMEKKWFKNNNYDFWRFSKEIFSRLGDAFSFLAAVPISITLCALMDCIAYVLVRLVAGKVEKDKLENTRILERLEPFLQQLAQPTHERIQGLLPGYKE